VIEPFWRPQEPMTPRIAYPGKVTRMSIVNIEMPTADKEYSWQLPKGLKWFTLHTADGTALRIATSSGKVAGSQRPYWTLKLDTSWSEENLDIQGEDDFFYFACGSASKVVEIIVGIEE